MSSPQPNLPAHLIAIGDNAAVLPDLAAELGPVVDAVYIDPPYDHGDSSRRANGRHFAYGDRRTDDWATFIQARLDATRPLLAEHAPVAVSISHQRLHELAGILTDAFPGWDVVTITIDLRRGGIADRLGVIRSADYLLIAVPPGTRLGAPGLTGGEARNGWGGFALSGYTAADYPNQVYPLIVDQGTGRIVEIGPSIRQMNADGEAAATVPDGCIPIWPVTRDGKDAVWRAARETAVDLLAAGMIRADRPHMPGNVQPFTVKFVSTGVRKRIAAGTIGTHGLDDRGALIIDGKIAPVGAGVPAVWTWDGLETRTGTERLEQLIGVTNTKFGYPKPVRLVADAIRVMTGGRPDAVILDFFAGSGTTLDAVVHLNSEDAGARRAILVQLDEGRIVDDVLLPRVRAVVGETRQDEPVDTRR